MSLEIRSTSHPNTVYVIEPLENGTLYCGCLGFYFANHCKHVDSLISKYGDKYKYPECQHYWSMGESMNKFRCDKCNTRMTILSEQRDKDLLIRVEVE